MELDRLESRSPRCYNCGGDNHLAKHCLAPARDPNHRPPANNRPFNIRGNNGGRNNNPFRRQPRGNNNPFRRAFRLELVADDDGEVAVNFPTEDDEESGKDEDQ